MRYGYRATPCLPRCRPSGLTSTPSPRAPSCAGAFHAFQSLLRLCFERHPSSCVTMPVCFQGRGPPSDHGARSQLGRSQLTLEQQQQKSYPQQHPCSISSSNSSYNLQLQQQLQLTSATAVTAATAAALVVYPAATSSLFRPHGEQQQLQRQQHQQKLSFRPQYPPCPVSRSSSSGSKAPPPAAAAASPPQLERQQQ